jgi:hypothetical protein
MLSDLHRLGKPTIRRASTYDTTGGNCDRFLLAPSQKMDLKIDGAGCIRHIWFTLRSDDPGYLAKTRLRMYWDGSDVPAVDCPFGDFFCLGHGDVADVVSDAVCVSIAPHIETPPGQAAFNCYFPMPFANGARVELENGCSADLIWYAHVDYEAYVSAAQVEGSGRFHAVYLREQTEPEDNPLNITGDGNYVILDTKGEGHFVGCCLSTRVEPTDPGKWWEGDDMIFVDGEPWPPAIHGTGTEDYFGNAWGFRRQFSTPYYGVSYMRKRPGDGYKDGLFTVYRFHVLDPIAFRKSIRVTVEHGHGNDAGNAFSSVAYYYLRP